MRSVVSSIFVSLLVVVASGCFRGDVFVFRPKPAPEGAGDLMEQSRVPSDLRREFTDDIASEDGVKVSAWVLAHRDDDGTPTERHAQGVFYCHGNNTHIGTTWGRLDALWELGYTVFVFDARGYGKTKPPAGGMTERGVFADARAAYDHFTSLEDLGVAPSRIGLYGRSLGSAICLHVATERSVPALIVESPISALQSMIDDSSSLDTPLGWWADSSLDTPAMAARFQGDFLVMHGVEDDYVRPEYGELLHESASQAKSRALWLVPGADHGNLPCARLKSLEGGDCEGGFSDEWKTRTTDFFDRSLR